MARRNGKPKSLVLEPQATSRAYRITDRRGQDVTIHRAAKADRRRSAPPPASKDSHRFVSGTARITLLEAARDLMANFPALAGAVMEQADLAVGSLIPQYVGEDPTWGMEAEVWLNDWHKIMDFRGAPWDFDSYRQFLVQSPLVDGDIGTLLVETNDGHPSGIGYPRIQIIPGHRIKSSIYGTRTIDGKAIDGVIVDDYMRPIAYRIETMRDGEVAMVDVPARDFHLTFIPTWPDQVRGYSHIAPASPDFQDVRDTRTAELTAHKAASKLALIENNEDGGMDPTKSLVGSEATYDETDATNPKATGITVTESEDGTTRYFTSNSGSGITAFKYDRPGLNSQMFVDTVMRDAFRAIEWDIFFSLDPTKVGGAAMRVIVDRLVRVLRKRRRMVIKTVMRVDGYALGKAMGRGDLRTVDDWYKWEYLGPGNVTADRKYESSVDLEEHAAGFVPYQEITAKRGHHWQDVIEKEIQVKKYRMQRAQEEFGDPNALEKTPPQKPPGQEKEGEQAEKEDEEPRREDQEQEEETTND